MKKSTTPKMYTPASLMELGFVHQYDSTENEGTPDEFSYSMFKLDLNTEAYLECTVEYNADKIPRLQYFSLQAEDVDLKQSLTPEEIKFLKKLFKN